MKLYEYIVENGVCLLEYTVWQKAVELAAISAQPQSALQCAGTLRGSMTWRISLFQLQNRRFFDNVITRRPFQIHESCHAQATTRARFS